jgi:CRP-like cAMP-binding protein
VNIHKLIGSLRRVRHFQHLPLSAIREIVLSGSTCKFAAGKAIYHERDDCSGLFVLLRGEVHLYKSGLQGQEAIISVIHPVIMFNEVASLDGGGNPTTAIAAKDCFTWHIDQDTFGELIIRYPLVGTSLLRVLARRNRLLISSFEDLFSRPVVARTARILLQLSGNGTQPIDRLTHTNLELAARAATVPEAISRTIQKFAADNLIERNRTEIQITDPDALSALALIETDTLNL